MNKKVIISTILFFIVFVFSFFALLHEGNKTNETKIAETQTSTRIILFYGDGCPHCEVVENYIEKNQTKSKISFVQKEVYYNQDNAKELEEKARICGLPTDSIGVPFLWDGANCLSGDQDIINFFKQKTDAE